MEDPQGSRSEDAFLDLAEASFLAIERLRHERTTRSMPQRLGSMKTHALMRLRSCLATLREDSRRGYEA